MTQIHATHWIGIDLDGTLAEYHGWKGPEFIGNPIPQMVERVKKWIAEGKRVKIFTTRACHPTQIPYVKEWLFQNDLGDLEITCIKDFFCVEIWDDRCIQLIPNTGTPVVEYTGITAQHMQHCILCGNVSLPHKLFYDTTRKGYVCVDPCDPQRS